jgi:nitrous oxidase accessory protein NosD
MLTKKIGSVISVLALMLVAGVLPARAQDSLPCFTLASFRGSFAVIGTYGANDAIALGKRHVDNDGNFTGTFVVNKPVAGSTTGERTIVTGTQGGAIAVNCDGTGVITRVLTVAGVQTTQMDDFVITGATVKDGELIATTIADAQRTPSTIVAGGIFLKRTWTRLP